jgi:phosphoglycolate phosphatase
MPKPSPTAPPAVILDLDGTLADTLEDITAAVNYALEHGMLSPLTPGVVRGMVGDGLSTLIARAADTADPVLIAFLVRRFQEHYDEHCLVHTRLYPGAAEFLTRCDEAGVVPAIVSNKPHEFTLRICDALLEPWFFGAVVGARDGLPGKPHPAAALAVADVLQRRPADMFFVGDSVVDVAAAQAAGMRSIAVTWGFQDRAPLEAAAPDHVVDSFEELWRVVGAGVVPGGPRPPR